MHISLVGINHQTAPVSVREKVAVSAERLPDSLAQLHGYMSHGVILSTCNRTEIYTAGNDNTCTEENCLNFLKAHLDTHDVELRKYIHTAVDRAALEHLFRVACGLESMIIGEFEVLGQVGQALEAAEKANMVDLPLRRLFQDAIRTGRRVRRETGISKNALSVSSVAVDLAQSAVGKLRDSRIVIIGAGEAGRLVVKAARERGVSRIAVVNRTREKAVALAAALGGVPVELRNLTHELRTADIVVTCSAAPHRTLDVRRVSQAMKTRPGLPLVIIDIGVPRNVEPAVKQIKNVFLYNIDDLTRIADANRKQRVAEMRKAEAILAAEVDKFMSWWQTLKVQPLVSALMSKADEIRSAQLQRTLKKLRPLSDEEQKDLEAMTRSIVTRILEDPVHQLKMNFEGNGDYAEMISKLFGLDEKKQK